MGPVDLFSIVLALAVLIGCINHIWVRLPPEIGMLLGSLVVSLLIISSDHVLHLHIMRWFRETLGAADLPHFFLDSALALFLFAGSLHVDVVELNRRRWVILLLATASVILSTAIFGYGIWPMLALSVRPYRWPGASFSARSSPRRMRLWSKICCAGRVCRRAFARLSSARACSMMAPAWCCFSCARGHPGRCHPFRPWPRSGALIRDIAGGARSVSSPAGSPRCCCGGSMMTACSCCLAGSGFGLLSAGDFAELSGPIAVVAAGLCLGSPSPQFGMTPDTAFRADRFLVAAQSDLEHHSVFAHGAADLRVSSLRRSSLCRLRLLFRSQSSRVSSALPCRSR